MVYVTGNGISRHAVPQRATVFTRALTGCQPLSPRGSKDGNDQFFWMERGPPRRGLWREVIVARCDPVAVRTVLIYTPFCRRGCRSNLSQLFVTFDRLGCCPKLFWVEILWAKKLYLAVRRFRVSCSARGVDAHDFCTNLPQE